MANLTTAELAKEIGTTGSYLSAQMAEMKFLDGLRPGRGKRWLISREIADQIKSVLGEIPRAYRIRTLSDEEVDLLASEFADDGPVQCPDGVDVYRTIRQLKERHPDLLGGVHVAEVSKVDGIILVA